MARAPRRLWQCARRGFGWRATPGKRRGDDIWMILAEAVGPDRLELIETDVMPTTLTPARRLALR